MRIHERDLTPEMRRALVRLGHEMADAPIRSKYRAVPTVYNGVRYASKLEARRAQELDLEKASGAVVWWIGQPTFRLGAPENVYRPDFLVAYFRPWPDTCAVFAEETKGHRSAKFRRDLKLWRRYGPMPLRILGAKGVEEIITPEHLA